MKLNMALCFLDDDGKIVVKEDLNVSWDLKSDKDDGVVEESRKVLVMDDVAEMLTYETQQNLYYRIRELLTKAKGIKHE